MNYLSKKSSSGPRPDTMHHSDMASGIPSESILCIIDNTLTLCFDILSGICSDILYTIYSDILSGIYFDILSGILDSGILSGVLSVRVQPSPHRPAGTKVGEKRREGGEARLAPLLKSRDPHLAGGNYYILQYHASSLKRGPSLCGNFSSIFHQNASLLRSTWARMARINSNYGVNK